jgi:DNA (cytosine-5)-methyltransferase 1
MNAIDLFCGCGGASIGLKMAGYKIVGAVDNDPIACKTYSRNLGLIPVCENLRFFNGQRILQHYDVKKGDVDLVIGCPPCQGFSSLRTTTYPTGKDPRNSLVSVFLRRVAEINPKAVVLENVPGIARKHGQRYLSRFLRKMEKMGYKTNCAVVNAADYGVAQFRRRVFAICAKSEIKPSIPPATHGSPEEGCDFLKSQMTVRDRIADMPPLVAGEDCSYIPNHRARNHPKRVMEIIRNIPKDGGSRRSLPPNLWLPCHQRLDNSNRQGAVSIYGRMTWNKPSPTITCRCTTPSSGRFVHPEQDRAITPREAARLQSFPDDFVFPDDFCRAERLIGNAVPPLLMEAQLQSIDEIL